MHLSYNVIKEDRVISKEKRTITTEVDLNNFNEKIENNQPEVDRSVSFEEAQLYIKNYENIANNILEDAKKKRDEYIYEASERARDIEKEAYEKGYAQGLINGEEDGKKQAYEMHVPEAIKRAEDIIANAENILSSAQNNYELFLQGKRDEILELSLTIAEQILRKEVQDKASINNLVDEAIKLSKGEENIVIRCNSIYEDELKKQIPIWKTLNNIVGEIFIIADENMDNGNAIVEKKTGKIEVGIDIGLEKIREAIC